MNKYCATIFYGNQTFQTFLQPLVTQSLMTRTLPHNYTTAQSLVLHIGTGAQSLCAVIYGAICFIVRRIVVRRAVCIIVIVTACAIAVTILVIVASLAVARAFALA